MGTQKFLNFFFEKISQCRKLCRKHPIPYLNTCITYLNTLTRLQILIHELPILIHWLGFRLHILIHALPILIHWLGSRLHILIHCGLISATTRVFSQSKSSTEETHQLRQPIRIEYYVTRVVSQSESSTRVVITSPKSSRLGLRTLLGSQLDSARYSLS